MSVEVEYQRLRELECPECCIAVTPEYLRSRSDEVGECWEWNGALTREGAPSAYLKRTGYTKSVRRAYLMQKGPPKNNPFPRKWRATTLCKNMRCVRPEHIVAVKPSKITKANAAKANQALRWWFLASLGALHSFETRLVKHHVNWRIEIAVGEPVDEPKATP